MPYKSTLDKAPVGNFISFLLVLGWEGPAGIYIGVRDGDWIVCFIGTIITIAFWGFGWWLARDFFRWLCGKLRA